MSLVFGFIFLPEVSLLTPSLGLEAAAAAAEFGLSPDLAATRTI
jgi:hypothetical protein